MQLIMYCLHSMLFLTSGFARIWCEEGHETKKKQFKLDTKILRNSCNKQWQSYCPVYFSCAGNHLSLIHTAHVHARGRPLTHVAAVARNNAKLCWYCVVLRDTACSCSKIHAKRWGRACTCVAAISVNAVIEINVFDYNVHARARAQCEWGC